MSNLEDLQNAIESAILRFDSNELETLSMKTIELLAFYEDATGQEVEEVDKGSDEIDAELYQKYYLLKFLTQENKIVVP